MPKNIGDALFRGLTIFFALAILGILITVIYHLGEGSVPALVKFGWGFLTGTTWDPVAEEFGALPFIYGTVVSALLALVIAVPFGLGTAIYLSEYAPLWLRTPVSFVVELLAAIPSIVYGLWGIFVLAPWLRTVLQPWLGKHLGFLPLFQGPAYGVGILAGGVILAIMILPIITAISRECLQAVPHVQREAMLALGATRWEMVSRAVLPYAQSGILGAILLGLGRAVGEAMAITMVIGNSPEIVVSLFGLAQTMASLLVNEFAEATAEIHLATLIGLGLILMAVTLLLTALARLLVWRVGVRFGMGVA